MSPTVKNALLFVGIGCILILVYLYIFDKQEEPPLVSSSLDSSASAQSTINSSMGEFLPLLLSVRNIELDVSLFSDPVFLGLKDSSIELIPDGNEGRPNPFAPIGTDIVTSLPATNPATSASGTTSSTKTGTSSASTPATQ